MLLGNRCVNAHRCWEHLFNKLDRCVHDSPSAGEDSAKLMACRHESNPRTFLLKTSIEGKALLLPLFILVTFTIIRTTLTELPAGKILPYCVINLPLLS